MAEHVKEKSVEEIIKEKYEEIAELSEIFAMEISLITFLQQENLQLKVKQLPQDKLKAHIEADKGKWKELVDDDKLEDTKFEIK